MTSTNSSESQILKVDSRRRVRVSRQRRNAILDEFERSGLSGAAFAKLHGIKYSTFASWSLKRRKQSPNIAPFATRSPDFAEVVIDESESKTAWHAPGTLRIHLPGGAWLLLEGDATQSKLAAQFLRSLQA